MRSLLKWSTSTDSILRCIRDNAVLILPVILPPSLTCHPLTPPTVLLLPRLDRGINRRIVLNIVRQLPDSPIKSDHDSEGCCDALRIIRHPPAPTTVILGQAMRDPRTQE